MMLVNPRAPKLSILQKVGNVGRRGDMNALLVDTVEAADHSVVRKCHFTCYIDRFVGVGELDTPAGDGDQGKGRVGPWFGW